MQRNLFLRRDVVFLPRSQGIEFRTSQRTVELTTPGLYAVMTRLASQLDGTRSFEQILENETGNRRNVSTLIDWLQAEGMLISPPAPDLPRGPMWTYLTNLGKNTPALMHELSHTTLLIAGEGTVARAVARSALAFGMRVRVSSSASWLPRLQAIAAQSGAVVDNAPGTPQPVLGEVMVYASDTDSPNMAKELANVADLAGADFLYAGLYCSAGLVTPKFSGEAITGLRICFERLHLALQHMQAFTSTLTTNMVNATEAGPVFCGLIGQQAALAVFSSIVGLRRERSSESACLFNAITLLPAIVYLDEVERKKNV